MLDPAPWFPSLLAGASATLPLLTRGPGRPPIPDEPEAVLLQKRRRAIFRLVQKEPGITIGELRKRLNIPSGVFHDHMVKLMNAGLVEKQEAGGWTRLFPSGKVPPPDAPALANLTAKEIARVVLAKPGLDSEQIGAEAGKSQRTAQLYLRDLREAGYVAQTAGEGAPLYQPTAKLKRELAE
jgi:predicted transcriptional regulator